MRGIATQIPVGPSVGSLAPSVFGVAVEVINSLKTVRGFVGSDLPGQPCANPKAAAVVQVTGTFER